MMSSLQILLVVVYAAILCVNGTSDDEQRRRGKLFPIFQIITFPNSVCTGTSSKNGTCYTAAECTAKGGVSSGSCASSYGVCCVFSIGCGTTSSQNCTYFESTSTTAGSCFVNICKCSSNICQLRLDFSTFVITGPSTSTSSIAKALNGVQATGGVSVTSATQCLTDTFSVTNPNGPAPPVICGTNTGQHMYVDAASQCNKLAFQLGATGIGTTLAASRTWSIKITQYSCSYNNLAPPGCTQYFFGSTTGIVQTFNYAGGYKLANQDQNICVRKERGDCRICWSTVIAATDFSVSTIFAAGTMLVKKQASCCGFGPSGKKTIGSACATIPGALTTKFVTPGATRICGSKSGLLALMSTGKSGKTATVCSQTVPFSIRFISDYYQGVISATPAIKQKGFNLAYIMTTSGCPATG